MRAPSTSGREDRHITAGTAQAGAAMAALLDESEQTMSDDLAFVGAGGF